MIFLDTYSKNEYIMVYSFFAACIFIAIYYVFYYSFNNNEYLLEVRNKFIKPKNHLYIQEILTKYFPYYSNLNISLKDKFLSRVEVFMGMKKFINRQCERNDIVNILIAATAVQLTFGLENFSLFTFGKILIYPTEYFSKIRQVHHKGEINTQMKLIVLSAKHFLFGIKDPNDGINLGLHEMAHALNFHSFVEEDYEFVELFKNWEYFALQEMEIIKHSNNHFLRNYASSNIQEMFAVSTEYFFEKPKEFQEKLPILFEKLCKLYNQNPIYTSSPILIM